MNTMDSDAALARFGLQPTPAACVEIRDLLGEEAAKERRGCGDIGLLRVLCVQLFNAGATEDSQLIWSAKTASMKADSLIDIQLLCGGGLAETKRYLASRTGEAAADALRRIEAHQTAGDFDGFSPENVRESYNDEYWERPTVKEARGFVLSVSGEELAYLATPLATKQGGGSSITSR